MNNKVISNYEQETNRIVAKIMRLTSIFMIVALLANVAGFFMIPMKVMIIVTILTCIILWIPTIIERARWNSMAVKYISMSCAAAAVSSLAVTLSYHAVLFYIFPIALASLYFNRKLNQFAMFVTIVGVGIGMSCDYIFQFVKDSNLQSIHAAIFFGFAPRVLSLVAMSSIFFQRSERQAKVIENEQVQKDTIDEMNRIKDLTAEASKTLLESVGTLSSITATTTQANHEIANSTSNVAEGSSDTLKKLEVVRDNISAITGNVELLLDRSNELSSLSSSVNELTQGNKKIMDHAFESMEIINRSTIESKEIILQLEEKSKEISKIVDVINGISSQTNLLSLNAGIEAARAGEHGKGFAVVAMEIRKLSEQTTAAVDHIGKIINEVLSATNQAAEAMNHSAQTTKEGLLIIEEANKATEKVRLENESMDIKINEMSNTTNEAAQSSNSIRLLVDEAKKISSENLDDLTSVAAATEEGVATMDELSSLVIAIKDMAEQLEKLTI